MTQPPQPALSELGEDRGNTSSLKYNVIGHFIRPVYGKDAAKTTHVERV